MYDQITVLDWCWLHQSSIIDHQPSRTVLMVVLMFALKFTLRPATRPWAALVIRPRDGVYEIFGTYSWSLSNRYLNRSKLASTRLCNNQPYIIRHEGRAWRWSERARFAEARMQVNTNSSLMKARCGCRSITMRSTLLKLRSRLWKVGGPTTPQAAARYEVHKDTPMTWCDITWCIKYVASDMNRIGNVLDIMFRNVFIHNFPVMPVYTKYDSSCWYSFECSKQPCMILFVKMFHCCL